jgi:hypothetical protein
MSSCLTELLGAESFFPLRKTPAAATITLIASFPPQQVLSNKNIKIKQRKAKHVSKKTLFFSEAVLIDRILHLMKPLSRRK